jgi:predicted HD superfamily hydrolase involved in NAD metabolism
MYKMSLQEIEQNLQNRLSEKRYRHSLAVSECARNLALRYRSDPEKAAFSGLVHDVCKDEPEEKLLQMAQEFDIILTESEKLCPKLWHAVVGAAYVGRYFTDDPDIINAVRYHTTARLNMSLLEKIIYVADCISADRTYPTVSKLRELSEVSLDSVIFEMTRITIAELAESGFPLHQDTVDAYNQLCLKNSEALYGK